MWEIHTTATWPPTDIAYRKMFLRRGPTGSVSSLNDGHLSFEPSTEKEETTAYDYPDPGWRNGVVGFGRDGRPDPVRRVLTFTSGPLDADIELAGPLLLTLFLSSTNKDTDVIVKISEQFAQNSEERNQDIQPRSRVVTKGWLRASHRAIDKTLSEPNAPVYTHTKPAPLVPNRVTRLDVAVMPTAHRFAKGNAIRLEIANGDSAVTEGIFTHEYTPDKIGRDTIHHDASYPSHLAVPIRDPA